MAARNGAGRKIKVALIQMRPKPLDPEYNFDYASQKLRQAAEQGAELAVLPEYHLSAWEPENPKFIEIARKAHKYSKGYQALAAELGIYICAGTIVQTADTAEIVQGSNADDAAKVAANTTTTTNGDVDQPVLLNISPFISPKGELLDTYIKTNIWIPERDHLTSSVEHELNLRRTRSENPEKAGVAHDEPFSHKPQPHQIIETDLGKIGILICWDLAFPEAFRALVMQGAKIIIIPTYWTAFDMSDEGLAYNKDGEKLFLETTLVARAYENTCAIIFCNAGGPHDKGYLGLSQVCLPIVGRVEGSFTDSEEGLKLVDVDMEILEVAERNYKIRQDLASEEWHYGYTHAQ